MAMKRFDVAVGGDGVVTLAITVLTVTIHSSTANSLKTDKLKHVTCHVSLFPPFSFYKEVELVVGGSVINGSYAV